MEEEERRWGGGGENLRRFHAWRAVRGGTGQPDRAASLAGCTEGRQLLAGLLPPRIIRNKKTRERERKREREKNGVQAGDIPGRGQKGVARTREKSRDESGPTDRPVSARRKKRALKEREEKSKKRYALRET